MQKLLRWSAGLVVLALILSACQSSASESPSASASAAASQESAADVCAADAYGCVEIAAGDPVVIASANAITGDVAFLGNDINFGIQVAMNDRTTVAGREVELQKEDAGCGDATTGQTAAQAIVANPQVVAVIGTTCSRTAIPAMAVLNDAGIMMISPANTAPGLTNPDHETFIGQEHLYFRTAYNDNVQGKAVAQFACDELEAQTAATIHDGSPYAFQLQEVFVDQFEAICGGTSQDAQAINVGDTDFHAVLTTIAASAPDIIFMPIFDPEGPLVVNQVGDVAGLENTILIGADGVKDQGFIDAAGTVAQEKGMYFSGPDLNFGTAYTDDFLPKLLELEGTTAPLAPYHAHAFDAANIIFDAIEAVAIEEDGTLFVPREALRDYVASLTDYAGLTGTLTCDEFGDCGSPYVSIAQLKPDATTGDLTYQSIFTTRP